MKKSTVVPPEECSVECPFIILFGEAVDCVYMKECNCEDIKVCPRNGDAWCVENITLKNEPDECKCDEIEIIRTHEGHVCASCNKLKR